MVEGIGRVKQKYSRWLRSLDEGINGVAVEELQNGEEYIALYIRKLTPSIQQVVPRELDGYPVRLVEVGEIYAE